jgi:hypothetical protein
MSYLNTISSDARSCLSGAMTAVTYVVSATVQKSAAVASAVFGTIANVASRAINGTVPAFKGIAQSYASFYARSPAMAVIAGATVATTVAYVAYQHINGAKPSAPAADAPVAAQADETPATDAPVVAQTEETSAPAPEAPVADAPVVAQTEEASTPAPEAPVADAPVVAQTNETAAPAVDAPAA